MNGADKIIDGLNDALAFARGDNSRGRIVRMAVIKDFDSHRVAPYLERAIEAFLNDPPDSDYQKGYLAGILAVYQEGIGRKTVKDARVIAAHKLTR